jgi:hypothetical protein
MKECGSKMYDRYLSSNRLLLLTSPFWADCTLILFTLEVKAFYSQSVTR